jgi:hypothetical protein
MDAKDAEELRSVREQLKELRAAIKDMEEGPDPAPGNENEAG